MRYRASKSCKDPAAITHREKRTRTGCLTCRKRRKKCTEEKPNCRACVRNHLTCIWPGYAKEAKERKKCSFFEQSNESFVQSTLHTDIAPNSSPQFGRENYSISEIGLNNKIGQDILLSISIFKFMPEVVCQDNHRMYLSGSQAIVNQIDSNPVLRESFLCAGAAYLEGFDFQRFSPLSQQLYNSSWALIANKLNQKCSQLEKYWNVLPAVLILALRDSSSLVSSVSMKARCLNVAFNLIKDRASTIEHSMDCGKFLAENFDTKDDGTNCITPLEKVLLESFLYNYSVTLFFTKKSDNLPDPSLVYSIVDKITKTSSYNRDYEWASNPIFGASFTSFEIMAKLAPIARLPLPFDYNSHSYTKLKKLERMAEYYTDAFPTHDFKFSNKELLSPVKYSCIAGRIVAKSCHLLAYGLLNFCDLPMHSMKIRYHLIQLIREMDSLPSDSQVWKLLPWPVFMTGFFVLQESEKEKVLSYLKNLKGMRKLQYTGGIEFFFRNQVWILPLQERLILLQNIDQIPELIP